MSEYLARKDTTYLNLIFSDTIKFEQPFYHLAGRDWYKKIIKKIIRNLFFMVDGQVDLIRK